MNKVTKAAVAVLCAGALLCGVGVGVAFGEYSTMELRKLDAPGANDLTSVTRTVKIPRKAQQVFVSVPAPCDAHKVIADESVEPNTMVVNAWCSAVSDEIVVSEPRLEPSGPDPSEVGGEGGGSSEGRMAMWLSVYPASDGEKNLELVSRYRDYLLEGLKNGVIYVPPSAYDDFSVEVRVNPADIDRVSF